MIAVAMALGAAAGVIGTLLPWYRIGSANVGISVKGIDYDVGLIVAVLCGIALLASADLLINPRLARAKPMAVFLLVLGAVATAIGGFSAYAIGEQASEAIGHGLMLSLAGSAILTITATFSALKSLPPRRALLTAPSQYKRTHYRRRYRRRSRRYKGRQ